MTDGWTAVPGLNYLASWLGQDRQRTLLAEIDVSPWSTQLRRRVQHYGYRYDYKARKVDPSLYVYGRRAVSATDTGTATPVPGWAAVLADRLHAEGHTDHVADQVIVNEYQPGQGISAHVDCGRASARRSPR